MRPTQATYYRNYGAHLSHSVKQQQIQDLPAQVTSGSNTSVGGWAINGIVMTVMSLMI